MRYNVPGAGTCWADITRVLPPGGSGLDAGRRGDRMQPFGSIDGTTVIQCWEWWPETLKRESMCRQNFYRGFSRPLCEEGTPQDGSWSCCVRCTRRMQTAPTQPLCAARTTGWAGYRPKAQQDTKERVLSQARILQASEESGRCVCERIKGRLEGAVLSIDTTMKIKDIK